MYYRHHGESISWGTVGNRGVWDLETDPLYDMMYDMGSGER